MESERREALAAALYRAEWAADLYATPRSRVTKRYERRADRLAPLLAEAWDEGLSIGTDLGLGIGERILGTRDDWPEVPPNPYRAALAPSTREPGEPGVQGGDGEGVGQ